jgi:adenine-specific DNA-methyltransferase
MNTDLLTKDLKKRRSSNDSFWLLGSPDIELKKSKDNTYRVEVHGFDYYNTRTGQIESGNTSNIAMWMLDPDYDGRSLYPQQVFFPMLDESHGWANLVRTVREHLDEQLLENYNRTVSLPFNVGEHKRVAIKILDDRGIESIRITDVN